MFSIEQLEGISTRGGKGIEKSVIESALEDGTLGYTMSINVCPVVSSDATKSGHTLACRALAGEAIAQEGLDGVPIADVDGDVPPLGVRPKAIGGGAVGEEETFTDGRELGAVRVHNRLCLRRSL